MDRFKVANIVLLIAGLGLLATGIVLVFLFPRSAAPDTLPPDGPLLMAEGERIVRERNCNFCHRTERPQAHPEVRDNCQLCHQFTDRPEHLAPPLHRIAERRPEEWIRRYLRYPYKLREHSPDRMPDLLLSDREVHILTRYLVATAQAGIDSLPKAAVAREPSPSAEKLAQGRALYDKYTCVQCHTLGASKSELVRNFDGSLANPAARSAPGLDKTWTRTRPEWLAAAIKRPDIWMPWSGMPVSEMTETEAQTLAWYVMNAAPSPAATVKAEEVMAILAARCNGCHYSPNENAQSSANPAGGAGWIGTWGKPRKLDLMTIEGLMHGAVDDYSLLRPSAVPFAENAPLLMHLRGLKQPAMPFGGDPLPADEIDKIEKWILSGAGD